MDKFTKVRNIGKGNMGACALARNNDDGKYYVIKQVDLTRMNKKERQQSLNEARVLSSLRHPNVINYVDSFLAKKSDHLCIVMEFADGGDVSSRIKKNYGVNFRESQVLDWFIQLVLSLHYVHQRKILHRDVKTQNVFLTSDNVVKLGDFGIARTLSNTYDQAKTFVGTPYYLSPELILERPYDHRSDVWALGVVLYELLTLKHPFNASDMKGLMQRILKVQYDPIPMIYSTEVRNIVPRLLMKDPAQRMELADVLKLPVVQRRIMEWLNGDVVPQKYLDTLVKQNLLPAELIEKARVLQDRENCIRVTAPTNPSDGRHHPQEVGSALSHGKAMASGQSSRLHHSTRAESEEGSENGDTRTGGTDPVLPPLTARNRYSPSTVASEEVKTAPPTAYATPSTALRGHHDRLSPSASPSVSAQRNPYVRPQAQSQERTEYPVRRVSRQGAALGNGGARQALPPPQRAPLYRYYKTPSSNVSVAPPLYGVRQHKSHPPTTPPLSSQASARATPLPPRLSSLDNFYQQLNYYQQHRPAVGAAGGISSGATSARHGAGAASGEPAPSHSARSTAAPPAHIPVTVLSSRKVTRKRTEVNPPPSHINPAGRSNQHGGRGLGNGGAGAYSATPSTSSELGAGAPDIKAMLQRAAQERAQRRLGGVV